MSSPNFRASSWAKRSSPARRQGAVKLSSVSFQPIFLIDPTHSRAAEAARRPKGPTVTFAPFIIPSPDNPGTVDDSTTTDDQSTEEASNEDASDMSYRPSSSGSATNFATYDHHSPSMPFSQNPLASPPRTHSTSRLATHDRPSSRNLHNNTKNTKNTKNTNLMAPYERGRYTPAAPAQGSTGPGALLRGEYFSRSSAAKAGSRKPPAAAQKRIVIDLTSDDENESPATRRPQAAPSSSSYKLSLDFILNKSTSLSPTALQPASLTTPSFAMAQHSQTASSTAPKTSSFGLGMALSKPGQSYFPERERQVLPSLQARPLEPTFPRDQLPYMQPPPLWTPAANPFTAENQWAQASIPLTQTQTSWAQSPQAFTSSSSNHVSAAPAKYGGESFGAAWEDSAPMITIPTGHQSNQPGNGHTGSLPGLFNPNHTAEQQLPYGLPSLPYQVTNVKRATSVAHPSPQVNNQPRAATSGVKDSHDQTPTTVPAARSTPIIGKAGSRYRYGVSNLHTPGSKASRRGAAGCRDRNPERSTDFDFDFDYDTDDNDVLADFTRFTKRDRRQSAGQPGGAPHRVSHPKGSNGGKQDKRARPVNHTRGQEEREGEEQKTVQPGVQHAAVPATAPNEAVGSGPDAVTLAFAEKNAAEFEAIKGLMTLAAGRGGTAMGEIFDEPFDLQRARLQIESSTGEMANIRRAQDVANDSNTHQDGARSAEHVSASRETQEKPQHTQFRKWEEEEEAEGTSEAHAQASKKRVRRSSGDETEEEHRVSQRARREDPVKREDDGDHANIGAVARYAHDGASDDVPCTPSSTSGSATDMPTSQRGTKRVRKSAGPKPRPWEAGYKRHRTQRSKPAPQPKPSQIVSLRYVPANLPPKLRRIMVMGTNPKQPVGTKCFLLGRARRSQGAGYIELPLEVRRAIYRNLLVAEKPIEVLRGWSEVRRRQDLELYPALLGACRQMHDEAAEVLYSENSFTYALRDDAEMVALRQGKSWQLVMPLDRHIHHFRNLELVLQRSGTEKEEYAKAIYRAIWNLNYMGVNKLKKLTIVIRPHVDEDDDQVSMAGYFHSNNDVVQMLKGLRTDFIQIDVHLPRTNAETTKSIRAILDKRIEIDDVEILRQMDEQTEGERGLGREERRRLAKAQLVKTSKVAIDEQLHRLSTRIQNACTKGAAWVLQRGWFTEFESDVVPDDDYMDFAPHDDADDTDWEA